MMGLTVCRLIFRLARIWWIADGKRIWNRSIRTMPVTSLFPHYSEGWKTRSEKTQHWTSIYKRSCFGRKTWLGEKCGSRDKVSVLQKSICVVHDIILQWMIYYVGTYLVFYFFFVYKRIGKSCPQDSIPRQIDVTLFPLFFLLYLNLLRGNAVVRLGSFDNRLRTARRTV